MRGDGGQLGLVPGDLLREIDADAQIAVVQVAQAEIAAVGQTRRLRLTGVALFQRGVHAVQNRLDHGLQGEQVGMGFLQLRGRQRGDLGHAHFDQGQGLLEVDGRGVECVRGGHGLASHLLTRSEVAACSALRSYSAMSSSG